MTLLPALLLFITLGSSMQEMLQEYRLQLQASAHYDKRAYSRAESTWQHLLNTIPEEKTTSTTYNLACALYMQGKYAEASTVFARKPKTAAKHHEIELQSLFNEGNSLAMMAFRTKENSRKTALFSNSLNRFKAVLLNNPNDGDAKINYEIVGRYLHELEAPKQAPSSGSAKKSNAQPKSRISHDIAERLLEQAQQNESSLMRQLPRNKTTASQGSHNNRDW